MKINPDAIKAERLASGLTQEALAHRAGVSRSMVQFAERGRTGSVRANTISKLAGALKVSIADIAAADNEAEAAALSRQRVGAS